jgi:hypothetical protein
MIPAKWHDERFLQEIGLEHTKIQDLYWGTMNLESARNSSESSEVDF